MSVRFVCATMAHKGHEQWTVVPREAALLLAKSSRRKRMGMGEIKEKEEEGNGGDVHILLRLTLSPRSRILWAKSMCFHS